jgi:predicted DNA-binding antitoxin AbrB/MazE fold protein
MIEAVYEDGVFKPLEPVRLENGQKVEVYIPWGPSDQTPEQALKSLDRMADEFSDWTDKDWAEFKEYLNRSR